MKILVVDDDPDGRFLLEALLRAGGHAVSTAANGAEALDRAAQTDFGLIVSDILMPEMDGFALCRRIRSDPRWRHTRFVFYTATYTDLKDDAFALGLGADGFIVKPQEPAPFIAAIERVIAAAPVPGRSPEPESADETVYLRQYNQRLVRKLEDKMVQLERANAELRRLTDELERRVRDRTRRLEEINAALDAFAFTVSHDLRTPLRTARMLAQELVAKHGAQLDAGGRDRVGGILAATVQMDQFIQDLLVFSRLDRLELQLTAVPLDAVLSDLQTRLAATFAARDGQLRLDGPLPRVHGHYATLLQVIENRLANAVKFVVPGTPPQVRVWADARVGRARLWVEDNGIGIAAEDRDRIFEVFERLHGGDDYPGTGIGLAIVRKGVSRMDGAAGVESRPGGGSRFWIELPLAEGAASP